MTERCGGSGRVACSKVDECPVISAPPGKRDLDKCEMHRPPRAEFIKPPREPRRQLSPDGSFLTCTIPCPGCPDCSRVRCKYLDKYGDDCTHPLGKKVDCPPGADEDCRVPACPDDGRVSSCGGVGDAGCGEEALCAAGGTVAADDGGSGDNGISCEKHGYQLGACPTCLSEKNAALTERLEREMLKVGELSTDLSEMRPIVDSAVAHYVEASRPSSTKASRGKLAKAFGWAVAKYLEKKKDN